MKKGFTLVELLAVIVILGLIIAIVVPNVKKTLNKQKEKLYNNQIKRLEDATESWGSKNTNMLPNKENPSTIYVNLKTLVNSEILKDSDIIDPRSDETLEGCVGITFDVSYNQYTYAFFNKSDSSYNNECNSAI